MWSTQYQVDTWLNLGNGQSPDHWIRVSSIEQIRMTVGCERATVTLKGGCQIVADYTAAQLVKMITESNKAE